MKSDKIIRYSVAYVGGFALSFALMGWQRMYNFTTNLCIAMLWFYLLYKEEANKKDL